MAIKYTAEEQILLDNCLLSYKKEMFPDQEIDFNDSKIIVAALDFAHIRSIHIRNKRDHQVMFSIMDKNGVKVETPQARQARLEAERAEKIAQMEIERLEEKEKEAKQKVDAIKKEKKEAKKKAEDAKKAEQEITHREASALERAEKAEAKQKETEDMMLQMKAEFDAFKKEILEKKELEEVAEKLAEEAPEVIENEASEETVVPIEEEDKPIKEKSVEELIEELNK